MLQNFLILLFSHITSCSMNMAPQARSPLHDAFKTLNSFSLLHIPPPNIRNAWTQIRIYLLTTRSTSANTSSNPPLTAALDKIHKRLLLIENSVSVLQNTAKTPLSYVDTVKTPPPAARVPTEKFMPSRLLNEVTAKTSSDTAPLQSSPCVVEAINKTRAGKPGKFIAAPLKVGMSL